MFKLLQSCCNIITKPLYCYYKCFVIVLQALCNDIDDYDLTMTDFASHFIRCFTKLLHTKKSFLLKYFTSSLILTTVLYYCFTKMQRKINFINK